jgi:hypothetical protein
LKLSFKLKSIFFWDMMPRNPLSFNRRFGGTSQEMILFITIAVKTSNPAWFELISD